MQELRIGFVTASLNERSRRALRALEKVGGVHDRIAFVDTGTKDEPAKKAMRAGLHKLRVKYGERFHHERCDKRVRHGSGCNIGIRWLLHGDHQIERIMVMDADDSFGKPYVKAMRESRGQGDIFYPTCVREVEQKQNGENGGKTEELRVLRLQEPAWDAPPAVWAEYARYGATFAYSALAFKQCGLFLEKFKADDTVELVCRMKRMGVKFVAVEIPPRDAYRYYQHLGGHVHAGGRAFYTERRTEVARVALAGEPITQEKFPDWFDI